MGITWLVTVRVGGYSDWSWNVKGAFKQVEVRAREGVPRPSV